MIKHIRIWLLFIILLTHSTVNAQNKGDNIFDPTILHELRFTSETEPDLYTLIANEGAGVVNRPYHVVKMEFDGEEIDSIGLRAKGFASAFVTDQPPMKIDVNEYIDDQTFDGIKKISLTNSFADPYRQKDRVAYELFRRAGIAAPHTSYAEVYINDVFVNVYLLVEQVDKSFIKQSFSDKGSLMKIFELIYGEDVFTDPSFPDSPLDHTDIRNYFQFVLINSIIAATDNYPENNFYVYYSEKENIFHYLPWDYNLCMDGQPSLDGQFNPLEEYEVDVWSNPDLKALYLEVACELYNYLLDESYIQALLQDNYDIILSNSHGSTVDPASDLISYLGERRTWLKAQLDMENFDCGDFSYPYEIGDLVINEFVAKSDSVGGVQEPDGGTPDWIELYNNSNEDIILDHHFYLTDDVDFPKKWNFQSPVTIPAKGYQIIWADRDVHQQGAHSNFKIKKSGGDLMLVYEDMTILDQVSYEAQELNKGYARIPNGTGDFVIQDHTFNGDNDSGITATYEVDYRKVTLFPNPTSDRIYFPTDIDINHISVYNTTGQLLYGISPTTNYIDLSGVPRGIYYVKMQIENAKGIITKKITKM